MRQAFLCEKASKEYFPWEAPNPLIPTPPNGNEVTEINIEYLWMFVNTAE